jgi:hypothetical protein
MNTTVIVTEQKTWLKEGQQQFVRKNLSCSLITPIKHGLEQTIPYFKQDTKREGMIDTNYRKIE